MVLNRSVGDGTPGSKVELISSFVDEKLKLTMARFCLLICLIMSMSLSTSVDFVSMCTGKLYSCRSFRVFRVNSYLFSAGW